MLLYYTGKNLDGRAGEADVALFGIEKLQIAAGEMDAQGALGDVAENAGDADGGGAGAAGEGFAGAALPGALKHLGGG